MEQLSLARLSRLAASEPDGLPTDKLAVIGDCATQHISRAIRGTAISRGLDLRVFDADYDQILAQTADPSSELYAFAPTRVFIMTCTEKLYERFVSVPVSDRASFAEKEFAWIKARWSDLAGKTGAVIQALFTEYDDGITGSFASRTKCSFITQLRRLNLMIGEEAEKAGSVYTVDFQPAASAMGAGFFSSRMYAAAKLPFSNDGVVKIASAVCDVIFALRGKTTKCVILDLDNTLWGGVVGDDGTEGIQIGDLGTGHAFSAFQVWLRELRRRGVILCVCSKNDEDKAKDPFINHPDMVLQLDDFAMFVANWEPKPENIRRIQKVLNIGFDSMVFIDDNPFERESVRRLLPGVTVPELPEDPAEYVDFLRGEGLFETVSRSAEDAGRTEMYRAEAGRAALAESAASFDDYLRSLGMRAVCAPFAPFWFPRIAQLSQRSNQFNLRTVRYTEAEIARAASDPDCLTLYFTLSDSFGDSGLISAVIMRKTAPDVLFIDTWIMSCRVLKRTMEEFIINSVVAAAREKGYKKVIGEYLKTPKNSMVEHIYEKMGFRPTGNGRFEADTASFVPLPTFISRADSTSAC
ncbi:MAG: HAD family hydrolase [Clostridia bacterium]|nr:HAD family hydrolase [Clostridia bacterium]